MCSLGYTTSSPERKKRIFRFNMLRSNRPIHIYNLFSKVIFIVFLVVMLLKDFISMPILQGLAARTKVHKNIICPSPNIIQCADVLLITAITYTMITRI